MCAWLQVQVALSGYVLASVWGGASDNYSYPLYYDMGAPVQDHFLNWKVSAGIVLALEGQSVLAVQMMLQLSLLQRLRDRPLLQDFEDVFGPKET